MIEIDLPEGVRVRVDAFVNERALSRVLRVLKVRREGFVADHELALRTHREEKLSIQREWSAGEHPVPSLKKFNRCLIIKLTLPPRIGPGRG